MEDAENILAWARTKDLDVVFNMLRFTDAMLHNKELEEKIGFREREEAVHAQVLPRSRAGRVGAERPGVHVPALRGHDRQRLPPDDALPVPEPGTAAQSRTATCTTARTRRSSATCSTTRAESLYFKAENLAHREHLKDEICPTCLSPCQVNVGAMKQFVPYAKFLKRAYQVKRDPAAASRDACRLSDRGTRVLLVPRHALRIAVAVGLTAFILWQRQPADDPATAAGALDLRWIAAAVLLVFVDRALMALPLDRAAVRADARLAPAVRHGPAHLLRQHVRRHLPAERRRRHLSRLQPVATTTCGRPSRPRRC